MLLCLKQLNEKFRDNNKIRLIAKPFLQKVHSSLGLFECKSLTIGQRVISHLVTPDIAFFTETINTNWGYKAKTTYGLTNPSKKIIQYDKEMPFMNIKKFNDILPSELINFLQEKYNLSQYSITLFGILLELGYTTEQIIETFDLKPEYLALNNFKGFYHPIMNEKYVVFCMEAAYGKKGDANRRWDENFYVEIAERCFNDYNLKSVFVGIDKNFKLPDKPNYIDLRKQLDLFHLAQVLKHAVFYIGNDTAPLHIANIMQTPSVATYFMKHSLLEFSPLFLKLNNPVYCPEKVEDVYNVFKNVYAS